jgi:hypothetical protein
MLRRDSGANAKNRYKRSINAYIYTYSAFYPKSRKAERFLLKAINSSNSQKHEELKNCRNTRVSGHFTPEKRALFQKRKSPSKGVPVPDTP